MIGNLMQREYTPEDLLNMPGGKNFELVNGRLVERHIGILAGWVAGELIRVLGNHCRQHHLGWLLPGGYARLAPDLAAEVISPNDKYEEVDEKLEEYLRAGVRLVWIVSPRNHTVRVHRLNGSSHSLRDNDDLDGEDVLPGFRSPVRDLFPQPSPQTGGNGSIDTH